MKEFQSLWRVFQSQKMVAILLLGFSSGLPFALTDDSFRAWMTRAQLDLSTIGWFSLVSLPYSLKFLWSPFLDRFIPPVLGRRRGWMAVSQVGLIGAILALALQMALIVNQDGQPRSLSLQLLALTALALAFLSATQDIAIDAYRADALEEREVGAGASLTILGYRIALLLTGWIAFNLADRITWHWVYGLMALLMLIGLITSFQAPEPTRNARPPETLEQAVVQPFLEFFRRQGWKQAVFTLVFIILFKLGDAMVAKMAVPFLGGKGLGFADADIGNIRQGMGLVATIVGTLAGGALLSQLGINRSLWIFGGLQAISNLGYFALAVVGKNYTALVLAVNVENFCGGLGTAGFLGFLISLCNPRFSATQFALLSSLMAVGRDFLAGPASGELAQRLTQATPSLQAIPGLAEAAEPGWALFFLITLVAAIPGLALLPFFAPWNSSNRNSFPVDENNPGSR
ncbi:AmpG family muropeptide MFS transporter [Leptothermofonsia sichuanensis]|uniref:AmpG family muropeptide MFS transporter n=1 Tax=Leptothermofonsia sichuanensis TaxID=2917832 RepID=UPI001CED5E2A|nr:AmpG family muropeptide MFS transporter [Leptothermofonsia sichuanensis]